MVLGQNLVVLEGVKVFGENGLFWFWSSGGWIPLPVFVLLAEVGDWVTDRSWQLEQIHFAIRTDTVCTFGQEHFVICINTIFNILALLAVVG